MRHSRGRISARPSIVSPPERSSARFLWSCESSISYRAGVGTRPTPATEASHLAGGIDRRDDVWAGLDFLDLVGGFAIRPRDDLIDGDRSDGLMVSGANFDAAEHRFGLETGESGSHRAHIGGVRLVDRGSHQLDRSILVRGCVGRQFAVVLF